MLQGAGMQLVHPDPAPQPQWGPCQEPGPMGSQLCGLTGHSPISSVVLQRPRAEPRARPGAPQHPQRAATAPQWVHRQPEHPPAGAEAASRAHALAAAVSCSPDAQLPLLQGGCGHYWSIRAMPPPKGDAPGAGDASPRPPAPSSVPSPGADGARQPHAAHLSLPTLHTSSYAHMESAGVMEC